MMQSTSRVPTPIGLHVAIIMDGNGRWASARGLPRHAGHRAGSERVREIVEAAPTLGIGTLSMYAFSSDNWRRPTLEVEGLMRLFAEYLRAETTRCVVTGVKLSVIGRRDRLAPVLNDAIERAEAATSRGTRLHLRLAVDYSSRDAILRAAQCLVSDTVPSRDSFGRLLAIVDHGATSTPNVDLVVRTGGEKRLSDFLLWESAYAELYFTSVMWPDFGAHDLRAALDEYRRRDRRFGALPEASPLVLSTGADERPA